MTAQTAQIYLEASADFAAAFVKMILSDHWQWVLAIVTSVIVVTGLLIPEVPQFMSLVVTDDGRSAVGQRVFGVPTAGN